MGRGRPPKLKLSYPDPSEDELQTSIANLFEVILPKDQVVWTHIAHGGYELSPKARGRLYRLGLKRGFSDFVLAYGLRRVLWMEIKTPTGTLSADQQLNHALLKSLGHPVVVCRSVDDVMRALVEHGVPHRPVTTLEKSYGASQSDQSAAAGSAAQFAERAA